jgi:hypothetical protein
MRNISYIFILIVFAGPAGHREASASEARDIYAQIGNESMSFDAFKLAFKGWTELKDSISLVEKIMSVVDFSQPSTNKRFYLIDMNTKEVIYQDYVAHGRNTGTLMAKKFSNIPNSNQSSLGFYQTAETYHGKHGLSLRLDGLEKGINDKARQRAIVIHSAWYSEESFIKKYGRLGRSFGCPALPTGNYTKIIELIKGGTLLFIYFPESGYLENSSILN